MVAWLALGLGAQGCADQRNPVLPSSTGSHGGTSAGEGNDGGQAAEALAVVDTQVARDATGGSYTDAAPGSGPDASLVTCNPFKQDCPSSPPRACYPDPTSGVGSCQLPGGGAVLVSCDTSLDPFSCYPGLVCVPVALPQTIGFCYTICDTSDPVACGFGNAACAPVPGMSRTSNVGYCQVG